MTGNRMYDPQTGKTFSLSNDADGQPQNSDPFWFADHVPLWITSTRQGKRTSVRYWSSCDVPFTVDNVTTLPEVKFAMRVELLDRDEPI